MNFLTIPPHLIFVRALVDVPCAAMYMRKVDVIECSKSSYSFSAVAEHGPTLPIPMAHYKNLVLKFNDDEIERTTTKAT